MDLFRRYGGPITVLNLVRVRKILFFNCTKRCSLPLKSKEKSPREMILREAFGQAVEFINSSIDDEKHKLIYMAWDFKKAAKNNRSKLQRDMMAIAQLSAGRIGFFHSGKQLQRNLNSDSGQTLETIGKPTAGGEGYPALDLTGRLQTGVVRTNCIDSIDRTNAAQYVLGLCMLGHQLYAMGLLSAPQALSSDSGISLLLLDMYEMAGHQLALQYGGSGLAHTMNTFNSKSIVDTSKDFWTTIQRYYSNTFTDQEKQNSINLFLGVFKPWQTDVRLWVLETDYFLHMTDYCRELL
jgi:phosphatidylinositol 3,5-bisphosphate 5-phosphatase